LVLAEIAAAELGHSAKLSQLFAAQAEQARRAFKRRLTGYSGSNHGPSQSKQPAASHTPDRPQSPSQSSHLPSSVQSPAAATRSAAHSSAEPTPTPRRSHPPESP